MNLGTHVSIAGGVANAPLNAEQLGITTFQIFSRNQKKWQSKPLTESEIESYRVNCSQRSIRQTMAHIGEGEIGLEPFSFLLADRNFMDLPGILETPDGPEKYAMNLNVLRNLL